MKTTLYTLLLGLAAASTLHAAQGPLPAPIAPPQNPITPDKAVLGKMLFWEEQLSSDNTMACGTCHGVPTGFTDARNVLHPGNDNLPGTPDDLFTSPGVIRSGLLQNYRSDPTFGLNPQLTSRRTPDIFGALYAEETFWDGRGSSSFTDPQTGMVTIPVGAALESQVLGPIVSGVEMGHEGRSWDQVVQKLEHVRPMALAANLTPDMVAALQQNPTYPQLFRQAFGTTDITAQRIAYAIATYERTLVPNQSPWDLFQAGNPNALTPDQIAGMNQFMGPASCNLCHTPPFFTDNQFHNLGLRPIAEDAGRQQVTQNPDDRGKFKTPSLRNAGLRQRFFHNGQESVLNNGPIPGGVDGVYIAGGGPFPDNKDPLLRPLVGLPGINMQQIMDFVGNGLTDPRVAQGLPPFDKPTLYSERHPAGADRFGPANAGGNGIIPQLITRTPATLGGFGFKIGLREAPTTAAVAMLGLSRTAGSGTLVRGVPFNLQGPVLQWIPAPIQVDDQGQGYTTFHLMLPAASNLLGTAFYAQAFVDDPSAPGGTAAATSGAAYEFQ